METILNGDIGKEITLKSFNKEGTYLINSFGGSLFEGLAIYDYVKGSGLEVGCIGVCASAATLALLASPNSWGTPNSRYLIHNPAVDFSGTASEMQKDANDLMQEQNRAVDLYAHHLNISASDIQNLMNQEIFITAQTALEIGLIKSIKEYSKTAKVKPNADMKYMFNQFKMCVDMSEQATKDDVNKLERLIMSVKDLFKVTPKMIVLTTADGASLDFTEAETEEQIAKGSKATVDGKPAEGNYVMPDGKTFVFVGGKLTEMIEADSVDVEALKAENEQLKAQLLEMQTTTETMKAENEKKTQMLSKVNGEFEKVVMEFNGFKTKFSVNKPVINTPASSGEASKKKFNFKK